MISAQIGRDFLSEGRTEKKTYCEGKEMSMKQAKRRLLSVVMALAILCSLVPAALAYGNQGNLYLYPGQRTEVIAPLRADLSDGFQPLPLQYVEWQSSSGAVSVQATNYNGTTAAFVGNYAGTAEITATGHYWNKNDTYLGESYKDSVTWTVTVGGSSYPGGSTYSAISQNSMNMKVGENAGLSVSINSSMVPFGYKVQNVRWSSSNPAVVSVANVNSTYNSVSALQNGYTTITATVDIYNAQNWYVTTETLSCYVTVGGGTSGVLTLSSSTMQMPVGSVGYLTASAGTGMDPYTTVSWQSSNPSVVSVDPVSVLGNAVKLTSGSYAGRATITATCTINGRPYSASCEVSVGNGGRLVLSNENLQMSPNSTSSLSVYSVNGTVLPANAQVTWETSNTSIVSFYTGTGGSTGTGSGSGVTLVSGAVAGQATVTATATVDGTVYTGSCLVTVGGSINAKATVSRNEIFTLGSINYKTPTSVAEQIASSIYSYAGGTVRSLSHVVFSSVTSAYGSLNATTSGSYYYNKYVTGSSGSLGAVTFTPNAYSTVGNAVFTFTAYDTAGGTHSGTLTITVEQGGGSYDVLYSATLGQSVQLNVQDFSNFWSKNTNNWGTLRYVTFGMATGSVGSLRYTGTNGQQMVVNSAQQFYVSPSYNQTSLGSVSFVPTRAGTSYRSGTLAVPFTAYGTTSTTNSTLTSKSGTLYIMVTNGAVQDINYQAPAAGVKLSSSDFLSVYRAATDSSLVSNSMYIQFLNVPAYGSLYYATSGLATSGTKLTASNIGSMMFSSTAAGSNSINALTYIPGSGAKTADTVRYIAYSSDGRTPVYTGEINFGVTSKAAIKYHTNSAGVTFKATDFFNTDTGLLSVQYINFGKPSSGTLYKNYSNGKGTVVGTNDLFSYTTSGTQVTSLNNVTYVPAAGYTGVVSIPYTGSNITGAQISGTVKVYVVSKAFTDVPTTLWSYEYVTELTASGIVNGVTPTTFYPNSEVKYGEALKLIMLAAGYSEQSKTGSHWASGYLTRAYRDGLVTNPNIDLNATVDRNTIASIAAKALKLSPVTNITSPFVDSNDGYVLALYQAGIVEGTTTGGRTYYYGTSTIKRGEICAIICRINDYNQ